MGMKPDWRRHRRLSLQDSNFEAEVWFCSPEFECSEAMMVLLCCHQRYYFRKCFLSRLDLVGYCLGWIWDCLPGQGCDVCGYLKYHHCLSCWPGYRCVQVQVVFSCANGHSLQLKDYCSSSTSGYYPHWSIFGTCGREHSLSKASYRMALYSNPHY